MMMPSTAAATIARAEGVQHVAPTAEMPGLMVYRSDRVPVVREGLEELGIVLRQLRLENLDEFEAPFGRLRGCLGRDDGPRCRRIARAHWR